MFNVSPAKGQTFGETLGAVKTARVNNFSAEKYVCSPKVWALA
jgi:hypothetical protein